jgi:transcriptional regulator with XRE-family HTH domain
MAEKIGTSRRHYIRIENGQHRPGRVLLAAIVRETGATDLTDEDDEEAASMRFAADLFREVRRVAREEARA